MRHVVLRIMNLGIFLFIHIFFFLLETLSLFLSLSFPSFCDQHSALPVITAVQNSAKTDTERQQNIDEKQNVLSVLMYLLSSRDCTEERFIVAFVKYNPGLFMHTLLESQWQAKKEGKDSSFFQAPFRIKRTAPAIPLMNWWFHYTDLVNMQMLKGSSLYFYLLGLSNGPK